MQGYSSIIAEILRATRCIRCVSAQSRQLGGYHAPDFRRACPGRDQQLAGYHAPDFRRARPGRDQQLSGYHLVTNKQTFLTRIQALRRACPGRKRRLDRQECPMEPIYTAENTKAAYQLNWSVALFGATEVPAPTAWLPQLKSAAEPDGVRILECHWPSSKVVQLLISALPPLSPSQIVRSVKGRFQYVIRDKSPKAFRRNYFIGSVGEVNSRVLDQYIGKQAAKHPMADPTVQSRLEAHQFHDPRVDLSSRRTGNYGQYVHSLQIVLESSGNWHEVREDVLSGARNMIVRCASKKGWLLSRIGLLSNHLHILIGIGVNESPESAALSLLNNLAFAQGCKPVFKFSYYAGTFGRYDRKAIRRAVNEV